MNRRIQADPGRKTMLHRLAIALALLVCLAVPDVARAEADKVRVAKQFGLAYMQFMVMEDQKLIEKHANPAT
jgi:NitT/TauT family transport system substrate-binding protein